MEAEIGCRVSACRPDTLSHRNRAVERVIRAMHEHLGDSLSLRDMARVALMSPYHFNRVFGQITGIPPSQFLSALRLGVAKRLLLTTDRSVTDICFDVGYNSLGSFITRFTQTVGKSPRHLRRLREDGTFRYNQSFGPDTYSQQNGEGGGVLHGQVCGSESFVGRVFVGLFQTPIPQGRPIRCAVLHSPGPYAIEHIPDGVYYVLALGVPWDAGLRAYTLCENTLRGRTGPVVVGGRRITGSTTVSLRPARLTDAPILMTLPFLLRDSRSEAIKASCGSPFAAEATCAAHGSDDPDELPRQSACAGGREPISSG